MALRKWHIKSKLGCLRCKQRRVKCDRGQPSCGHCARSAESCLYPSDADYDDHESSPKAPHAIHTDREVMALQLEDAVQSVYKKRWHHKSRRGCLTCRKRRVKCDESTPACRNCGRMRLDCRYESSTQPEEQWSSSNLGAVTIPAQLFVARLNSHAEVIGFEYFDLHILPMFRTCHPSKLWKTTIGYSAQTNDTIRRITIALGYQQCLLESGPRYGGALDQSTVDQSDAFYASSVSSLRRTLTSMSMSESPVVALCCVLMATLECVRDSSQNLLVHLQSGVRLVSCDADRNQSTITDEMKEVASLLQYLCVSSWMYGVSPSYAGDYALVLQDIDFDGLGRLSCSRDEVSNAQAVHNLLGDLIYIVRQLMHPAAAATDQRTSFEQLYRARTRAIDLRDRLLSVETKNANRNFLEAKLVMTKIWLDTTLGQSTDPKMAESGYAYVLDLLEESLVMLSTAEYRRSTAEALQPFSIGTGAIYTLETILQLSHNDTLEYRALRLLGMCPPREGLWSSGRVIRTYYEPKVAVTRHTVATTPTDRLATVEDCITLAGEMLADLKIQACPIRDPGYTRSYIADAQAYSASRAALPAPRRRSIVEMSTDFLEATSLICE